MKRKICIAALAAVLISLSSCGAETDTSGTGASDAGSAAQTSAASQESQADTESAASIDSPSGTESAADSEAPAETFVTGTYTAQKPTGEITLTNKMTDYERARVVKRPFSLLDEQLPEPEVMIGNVIVTKEASISLYDEWLKSGFMTEEEYKASVADAEDSSYREALINGVSYSFFVPPDGYDGGKLVIDEENSFKDKEEFYEKGIKDYCKNNGYDDAVTENILKQAKTVFDAVISGKFTKLPDRYENYRIPFSNTAQDPYADFRSAWEFDREALAEIKDSTEEYLVYDEQLGLDFLVHVTLPPDYDASKTYPVLFMTDGVWRLNDHAELYKAMKQKEASDVILVSLAYSYNINGTEDPFRDSLFIKNREQLLDFITDDLMPYLAEQYHIDCADSTLFGHSMGGVFSHYACFKSDEYGNQPFFRYIVGSPAMFNLYGLDTDYDAAGGESEYGYFDRHDALDKKVFLCGGTLEDPDYKDSYHGHDSLLTGLGKMKDRLSAKKADFTYKLYESHHYQYVPSMLLEFLKAEYPAQ